MDQEHFEVLCSFGGNFVGTEDRLTDSCIWRKPHLLVQARRETAEVRQLLAQANHALIMRKAAANNTKANISAKLTEAMNWVKTL
jgi:hypothetical protein